MLLSSAFSMAIRWDPNIRGFLIVTAFFTALVGSSYLLAATNLGARMGFLVTFGGLFGWLTLLGLLWTIFGIGPIGDAPHWQLKGVLSGEIGATAAPPLDIALDEWTSVEEGSPSRGQAVAAVDELFPETPQAAGFGIKEASDYVVLDVYQRGGEAPMWPTLTLKHKPHYAVVQLQLNKYADWTASDHPGEAIPKAQADTSAPVVTVLMIRNLGSRRLPPAMVMVGAGLIFAALMTLLHRRDKLGMANRAKGYELVEA